MGLTIKKEQLEKKNISHYSCGTLGFVAPEVLQYGENGGTYDESCDIFSVGCISYLLLTGTPLF
jgi:serine/threonine protein kinase